MKIVNPVQELAARPGWSIKMAMCFLAERYESKYQALAFGPYKIQLDAHEQDTTQAQGRGLRCQALSNVIYHRQIIIY